MTLPTPYGAKNRKAKDFLLPQGVVVVEKAENALMPAGKDRIGNDLGVAAGSHYRDPHRVPEPTTTFEIDHQIIMPQVTVYANKCK